jgi:hypothetical protein
LFRREIACHTASVSPRALFGGRARWGGTAGRLGSFARRFYSLAASEPVALQAGAHAAGEAGSGRSMPPRLAAARGRRSGVAGARSRARRRSGRKAAAGRRQHRAAAARRRAGYGGLRRVKPGGRYPNRRVAAADADIGRVLRERSAETGAKEKRRKAAARRSRHRAAAV